MFKLESAKDISEEMKLLLDNEGFKKMHGKKYSQQELFEKCIKLSEYFDSNKELSKQLLRTASIILKESGLFDLLGVDSDNEEKDLSQMLIRNPELTAEIKEELLEDPDVEIVVTPIEETSENLDSILESKLDEDKELVDTLDEWEEERLVDDANVSDKEIEAPTMEDLEAVALKSIDTKFEKEEEKEDIEKEEDFEDE